MRLLLWVTHILDLLLAPFPQHKQASGHFPPPGGSDHLVSMIQPFVIFGMQCCNVLLPQPAGGAQEARRWLELMAAALRFAEWAGKGLNTAK